MNLRDQLKEILPEILPQNPNKSIKGTELIESVKYRLKQEYSDATLRYHFSIMSCDPSSPIAKVSQGQGYYLRSETIHSMNSAMNMINSSSPEPLAFSSQNSDLSIARANKFRAVVQRYLEYRGKTPFSFEESFSENAITNRWLIPDLAVVDWMTGECTEDGMVLDRSQMEVYRKLGQSPIRITSTKLRLELSMYDVVEDLHQCLATSEWSNGGEFLIAAPVKDPELMSKVCDFAVRYGIGITTFGLDADVLDDMPEPAAIENLTSSEFESLRTLFNVTQLAQSNVRPGFDWRHVSRLSTNHEDFARFERWVSNCLVEERAINPRDFLHQERANVAVAVA